MIDLNNEIEVENFPAHPPIKLPPAGGPTIDEQFDIDEPAADEGEQAPKKRKEAAPKKRKAARVAGPRNFKMTETGLYHVTTTGNGADAVERSERVSGPFEIEGRVRDPFSKNWGTVISFDDADDQLHRIIVTQSEVRDYKSLSVKLSSEGLYVDPEQDRNLGKYLVRASEHVTKRIKLLSQTGWHSVGDNPHAFFAFPDRPIGDTGGEETIFEGAGGHSYSSSGTLGEWQSNVAKPCEQFDLARFVISAALSGTVLAIAGCENSIFNVMDNSSRGKTTLMRAAASVAARGEVGEGIKQWNVTTNSMEAIAALANDACLIMDELGTAPSAGMDALIYNFNGGTGKQRMTRQAELRQSASWRAVLLSSAEITFEAKIAEDRGKRAKAGQLVRAADIPVYSEGRQSAFDEWHHSEPDEFHKVAIGKRVKDIGVAAATYYGTALPAFIEGLIAHKIQSADINEIIDRFADDVTPTGADPQIKRMAQRFGIVAAAGELAIRFGVLPWTEGASYSAAEDAFLRWLGMRGSISSIEEQQHVSIVRRFIETYEESRFEPIPHPEGYNRVINERAGYKEYVDGKWAYYILPEAWKVLCTGAEPAKVASTLAALGMLQKPKGRPGNQVSKRVPDKGSISVYKIMPTIFAHTDEDDG